MMSDFISLVNNEFTHNISILDRGFAYGDGFFETMLWKHLGGVARPNLKVEFWEKHYDRIKKGCDLMKIKLPNLIDLLKQREKILQRSFFNASLQEGILKLIITRGVGGRGYKFDNNMKPTIAFLSFPKPKFNPLVYENGVKVRFCKNKLYSHNRLFGLKHMNRLDSVLARSEWEDEFFEGIILDEDTNLVEGTMTNIFFVKGDILITPPIEKTGINGILRQVVIEKAKNFFKRIEISKVNKKILGSFDQMFLTNSVMKIVPVKKLGRKKFSVGENLKKLVNFFNFNNRLELKKNLELS